MASNTICFRGLLGTADVGDVEEVRRIIDQLSLTSRHRHLLVKHDHAVGLVAFAWRILSLLNKHRKNTEVFVFIQLSPIPSALGLGQWEDRLKTAGAVHGDYAGVHASDSANAWRNMASVCRGQSQVACLIIGAWQIARDRMTPGNLLKEALPVKHHLDRLQSKEPGELLRQLEVAIRDNLQGTAAALAYRYGELRLPLDQIFSTLLQFAVSEDGALHAEKYFHTVWDDFHATRESARWQHVVALARATASEYGRPSAGQLEARQLLGIV